MPPLRHLGSGKVRDIYEINGARLLFVASDRISAYDVVLPDPIPDKGRVLTGLSLHFFRLLDVPNHFISADLDEVPGLTFGERARLEGRSMVVTRARVVPVECVVRGYLYGSAWNEYRSGGGPATQGLPQGLRLAEQLKNPIFTPATKAASGHDQNLTERQARALLGDDLFERLRRSSLDIYLKAREHAATRGVILADTKFEFGFATGRDESQDTSELLLVDEVLTPDSSRYWPAEAWQPGSEIPSFDKQYLREWLDSTGWDHNPPAPSLPPKIIEGTRRRYIEAYERITGESFAGYVGLDGRGAREPAG